MNKKESAQNKDGIALPDEQQIDNPGEGKNSTGNDNQPNARIESEKTERSAFAFQASTQHQKSVMESQGANETQSPKN